MVMSAMPLRGVSYIDRTGQPFYDAAADSALLTSLKEDLSPKIELIEMDAHINDPEFAEALAVRIDTLVTQANALNKRNIQENHEPRR